MSEGLLPGSEQRRSLIHHTLPGFEQRQIPDPSHPARLRRVASAFWGTTSGTPRSPILGSRVSDETCSSGVREPWPVAGLLEMVEPSYGARDHALIDRSSLDAGSRPGPVPSSIGEPRLVARHLAIIEPSHGLATTHSSTVPPWMQVAVVPCFCVPRSTHGHGHALLLRSSRDVWSLSRLVLRLSLDPGHGHALLLRSSRDVWSLSRQIQPRALDIWSRTGQIHPRALDEGLYHTLPHSLSTLRSRVTPQDHARLATGWSLSLYWTELVPPLGSYIGFVSLST